MHLKLRVARRPVHLLHTLAAARMALTTGLIVGPPRIEIDDDDGRPSRAARRARARRPVHLLHTLAAARRALSSGSRGIRSYGIASLIRRHVPRTAPVVVVLRRPAPRAPRARRSHRPAAAASSSSAGDSDGDGEPDPPAVEYVCTSPRPESRAAVVALLRDLLDGGRHGS